MALLHTAPVWLHVHGPVPDVSAELDSWPVPSGRADVAAAVQLAQSPDSPYLGGKGSEEGRRLGFFVPPPFAIAHHLLKVWVDRGPWFRSQGAAGAAAAAQSNL